MWLVSVDMPYKNPNDPRIKAYRQSEKGKAAAARALARYRESEKGKTKIVNYKRSERGKASNARYSKSDKGKTVRLRAFAHYMQSEKGRAKKTRIFGGHSRERYKTGRVDN